MEGRASLLLPEVSGLPFPRPPSLALSHVAEDMVLQAGGSCSWGSWAEVA